MKRFLIPLLASIALPTVVNANENNGKLLEYKKLIEEGYEILDDLVLRDEKNPTYEQYMEEFSLALEKCNEAIAMIPENKEGYVCRGFMVGFHKKGPSRIRYQKKGLIAFYFIWVFKINIYFFTGLYLVSPASIGVFYSYSLTLNIKVISTDYR